MLATTIDEAIDLIDVIIADARAQRSRLGYFACLYRTVTAAVRQKCSEGFFEDNDRMRALDVVFANRYLAAIDLMREGKAPAQSWNVAFQAAHDSHTLILQHLFLGMNAHIGLDLGIAAAQLLPGGFSESFHHDFDRINEVLASLTDDLHARLTLVSPWIKLLDLVGKVTEDALVDFSITIARDAAWVFAGQLVAAPDDQRAALIQQRDADVAAFGRELWRPGLLLWLAVRLVNLRENDDVLKVLDVLSAAP
jgi:Family of unknown function (DUF5995)